MSEEVTARWALPLLSAGQAQKEFSHNEALTRIDMLTSAVVESADRTVPPADPAPGQCWIVATGGTGAWAGRDKAIAGWTAGGWRFCAPVAGQEAHVVDRGHACLFESGDWTDAPVRPDGYYVGGVQVLAGRQAAIVTPAGGESADGESRSAIGAILDAMRAHGLIAP